MTVTVLNVITVHVPQDITLRIAYSDGLYKKKASNISHQLILQGFIVLFDMNDSALQMVR